MRNDSWLGLFLLAALGVMGSLLAAPLDPLGRSGRRTARRRREADGRIRGLDRAADAGQAVPGQAGPLLLGNRPLAENPGHVGSGGPPARPAAGHVRRADRRRPSQVECSAGGSA